MKINDAIDGAFKRVKRMTDAQRFELKVLDHAVRTKVFNAQRGHKHPALLRAARRAKLRRS